MIKMMKLILGVFFVFIIFFQVCKADYMLRIVDIEKDSVGIECEIKIVRSDGTEELISVTNLEGYVQNEFNCKLLEKIIIIPRDESYYTETRYCPIENNVIKLTSIDYVTALFNDANRLYESGNVGKAAFVFGGISERLKTLDIIKSEEAIECTIKSAGKLLGINEPLQYDYVSSRNEISAQLNDAIITYQEHNDLKVSGTLNMETLKSFSFSPPIKER